ncbi:MAG: hypothetical protein ACXVH1_38890 [Solirubrobacteraceae bacterium]
MDLYLLVFITPNNVMKTMATPAIRRSAYAARGRAGRFDPALPLLGVVSEPVPAVFFAEPDRVSGSI